MDMAKDLLDINMLYNVKCDWHNLKERNNYLRVMEIDADASVGILHIINKGNQPNLDELYDCKVTISVPLTCKHGRMRSKEEVLQYSEAVLSYTYHKEDDDAPWYDSELSCSSTTLDLSNEVLELIFKKAVGGNDFWKEYWEHASSLSKRYCFYHNALDVRKAKFGIAKEVRMVEEESDHANFFFLLPLGCLDQQCCRYDIECVMYGELCLEIPYSAEAEDPATDSIIMVHFMHEDKSTSYHVTLMNSERRLLLGMVKEKMECLDVSDRLREKVFSLCKNES